MKFRGKIWKTGSGHVITVPAAFMQDMLHKGKEYSIEIKSKGASV